MYKNQPITVYRAFIAFIGLALYAPLFSQDTTFYHEQNTTPAQSHTRIMFYNVENLFDTENDSLKMDEDFLPDGIKRWTTGRYWTKIEHIYKTVLAVGGWNPPAIIGLCEVENRSVVYDLVNRSPLRKLNYQIIHEDSPDNRGIDVALLYRETDFRPVYHEAINIKFPFDEEVRTRDILYVKGILHLHDTLHIFINHWPSRSGGQQQSEPRRVYTGTVLKQKTDSILNICPGANIIITGDFNDEPEDISITTGLNAQTDTTHISPHNLYNLMYPYLHKNTGTEKHQGHWAILDQFVVSGALLNVKNKLTVHQKRGFIFYADYLLEEDKRYMGMMPFRTYAGPRYLGGYSDHLPVYIDLMAGP